MDEIYERIFKLPLKENTIWSDFNKIGFDKAVESKNHLAFINKNENIILSFNKSRNYAYNVFKVKANGSLSFLALDIPELQMVVDFLKSKKVLK